MVEEKRQGDVLIIVELLLLKQNLRSIIYRIIKQVYQVPIFHNFGERHQPPKTVIRDLEQDLGVKKPKMQVQICSTNRKVICLINKPK